MSYSSRFFLYGPFGLFLTLAAGVMIYWWIAATALAKQLDAENGHAAAPGITFHFAAKKIGGFPFRLDTSFTDVTISAQTPRGAIAWHSDAVVTHRLTYDSGVTLIEAAGPQDISWTGESGKRHDFRFTPGVLHASAIISSGELKRFDLDVIALASERFAAARAQFHLRHDPVYDALDLVAEFQSVRFAGDSAEGFAQGLSDARLEGRLAPASTFSPALEGKAELPDALEAWRKGSGGIKIDKATAFWGRCKASGNGAVVLDDAHRISGSLGLSLTDCDALEKEAAGIAPRKRAHRAMLAVLADLAGREGGDKSGALPATLVFKDGLIFVAAGGAAGAQSFFEPVGFLHALY